MKTKTFLLTISILIFTGCATLFSGSNQTILIDSNPKKAKIEINGEKIGDTPFSAVLKRNNEYQVKIYLEGYKTYNMYLQKKINGWVFGNILLGGIIGIIVDAATGAMYNLSPKAINIDLKDENTSVFIDNKKNTLHIKLALELDQKIVPHLTKIGQLERE